MSKKVRRRRRKKQRAGRILILLLPLLVLVLGGGAVLLVKLRANTEGGSGIYAGPAVFARAEEAAKELQQEKEQEAAQAQIPADGQENIEKQDSAAGQDASGINEEKVPEDADPAAAPKLRIVLDPGHGGPGTDDIQDLGADYRDTYEKYLTLKIAKALGAELSQYGNVEIFYTRESDQKLSLKERAAYASSVQADILISLHLNASEEHNFYGSEVFVSAFDSYYAKGAGLGEAVLNQLTSCGFVSKGVKTRLGSKGADYYGIIRECKSLGIPAIIIEHGYMDEDRDWSRMDTDEDLAALGKRDAAGIAAFYGLQKGKTLAELPDTSEAIPSSSPVRPDTTPPEEVWYQIGWQEEDCAGITLHAIEQESRVMYYDYSIDGGATYSSLELWTGGDSIQIECPLKRNGTEQFIIRVYNNYELRTEAVLIS